MAAPLLPSRFLFRYSIPCRYRKPLWRDAGLGLGDEFLLPRLGDLDGSRVFAEVRTAWSEEGIAFSAKIEGKKTLPWCRDSRPDESDGLRVWIDTRDTKTIHRASRFCQQFIFMPAGSGRNLDEPFGEQLFIARARENPKPVRSNMLKVRRDKRVDGYVIECVIPGAALTGWDPVENPKLGFTYAVIDREVGTQTFSCGPEFPYHEDPSLWATLELTRPE